MVNTLFYLYINHYFLQQRKELCNLKQHSHHWELVFKATQTYTVYFRPIYLEFFQPNYLRRGGWVIVAWCVIRALAAPCPYCLLPIQADASPTLVYQQLRNMVLIKGNKNNQTYYRMSIKKYRWKTFLWKKLNFNFLCSFTYWYLYSHFLFCCRALLPTFSILTFRQIFSF